MSGWGAIADLGDNVADVLPILIGAVLTILAVIVAGLSGLLVTYGFGAFLSLFDGRMRASLGLSGYIKAIFSFLGALVSLTFWIGLAVILFLTLPFFDFLKSLAVFLFPVLGAFGVLFVPGGDD
ncbi:MAG TPA: hypothetical protein VH349_09390 [Ktedonobacterales bacterium]|jgi:hypothetical protein